jgi:integrase
VRTDRSACNRICSTILPGGQRAGDLALAKLDWKRIEEIFAKWESGGLSPQARSRYASTLSKVIDHAMRSGWVRSNVVKQARRPRVPTHKPDVPVTADVRAALKAVENVDFNFYAYVLGISTLGCRRSELLAVHVDLDNRVITIRASLSDHGPGVGIVRKSTKRDDWRDVPITDQLAEVLDRVLDIRRQHLAAIRVRQIPADSYSFSDEPDGSRPIRPDSTSHRWLRLRGGNDVTLAMLRRYVSTQLLDVTNGDYRTVAAITGNG